MKCLLILASVVVASVGQGHEGAGAGGGFSIRVDDRDFIAQGGSRIVAQRAPSPGGWNYDPCRCQCVFPAVTYSCPSASGLCGNCQSVYNGRQWCYVDGAAAHFCSDTAQSGSGRFWSFEACATPHVGSSLCPY